MSSTTASNPLPITTPEPTGPVTVVDANGAKVTVQRPVNRIVCLTSVEIVYALGAGSKIVGIAGMLTTDVKDVLPSWILNLPAVGDKDTSPNIEVILELKPDLILASQRLTDENRKRFEDAGIAVIEDTSTGTRRNEYFTNLGLILSKEARASEIISYEQYYWNLVEQRVANLPRSQKPLVCFEWYMPWFSTGPGGSYTLLIETAGGINLGENASVSSPQLSSEFVMEKNPDYVIRMLDVTSGETYSAFQNLYSSVTSRTGMSNLNAVKNNNVYVIKSTLLVERDVIGLLYFAKWFHPDLFTDIDPAAVHSEMVQKYYGSTVSSVYLYP
ncbi:MAG: ABC transporter substrate-binding protein [Candidatus Bathyarchaeota archaeon]|nr:ABC transporter substrate-binding protein [Candidatus Bathyarchaeota archaeon]